MTPNNKLPEEMREQIGKDADEYARTFSGTRSIKRPYIAGATAWAGWKVKCDELQAQAKHMADALEWALIHIKDVQKKHGESIGNLVNAIENALQQFKDGKEASGG